MRAPIGRTGNSIEQLYDSFFNSQGFDHDARPDSRKELALQQVRGSIAPRMRPEERPCWTIVDIGINFSNKVPRKFGFKRKPIAQIAIRTDRISPIDLAGIIEGDHIRIRNEWRFVLVLDFDGRPGKYKEAGL